MPVLPQLAEPLNHEFGQGFDQRNLRNMRGFYQAFPIWNAVRTELNWTHYRQNLTGAHEYQAVPALLPEWQARSLSRQNHLVDA